MFSKPEEAIDLGNSLAARSLSNYRDLYKTFRSDPMLHRLHERMPMIAIWDDHEFSNDSWCYVACPRAKSVEKLLAQKAPIQVFRSLLVLW